METDATHDVTIAAFLLILATLSRILCRAIELSVVGKVVFGKLKYLLTRRNFETGSSFSEIYFPTCTEFKVCFDCSNFFILDCLVKDAVDIVGVLKVTLRVLTALVSDT